MYDGPKRPIEELASITIEASKFDFTVVDRVDGKCTERLWDAFPPLRIYVTPGEHDLWLRWELIKCRYSIAHRSFVAEAGQSYWLSSTIGVDGGTVFKMHVQRNSKKEPVPLRLVFPK
jgi:hypothetical protein